MSNRLTALCAGALLAFLTLFALAPANGAGTLSLMGVGRAQNSIPATLQFVSSHFRNGGAGNWSFTSGTLGTATATRYVAVTVGDVSGASPALSATICGTAATALVQQNSATPLTTDSAIFIAACPTGSTAAVVISRTGNVSLAEAGVYSLDKLMSVTPVATNSSVSTSGSPSVTASPDGVALMALSCRDTVSISMAVSPTSFTQDFAIAFDGTASGSQMLGSLSQSNTGATVTATYSCSGSANITSALTIATLR